MHYILGRVLATKYPTLFQDYSPQQIYVVSTDLNRTIMSAYSQLYGIYQGKGGAYPDNFPVGDLSRPPFADQDLVNKSMDKVANMESYLPFNVQPVPVHTLTDAEDQLLAERPESCPILNSWTDSMFDDKKVLDMMGVLNDTIDTLKQRGYVVNTSWDMWNLGDTLECNYAQNLSYPYEIEYQDSVYNASKFFFEWFTMYMFSGTYNNTALYQYHLLTRIYNDLNSFRTGKTSLKAELFSAHDTTVSGLLNAFNITTPDCLYANWKAYASGKDEAPYPNCIYPSFAS
mmetsp:Transcript_15459/g.13204  ORF Transcript_15459/g.13204 Transcript_15459/m.13204 type:complete len:287 (-) Transcript_15459:462-1322(-)